jgi:hypothetical protein
MMASDWTGACCHSRVEWIWLERMTGYSRVCDTLNLILSIIFLLMLQSNKNRWQCSLTDSAQSQRQYLCQRLKFIEI